MAKKTTAKNKKTLKRNDYCGPKWAKNVIIVILMVAIVCVTTALVAQIQGLKDNAITREQSVYLEAFPELARNVVSNLDIIDGKNEDVQMTEYGVTEDGKLYIKFKYAEIVDGQVAGEYKTGTVYIAEDKERGSFGYAFAYD